MSHSAASHHKTKSNLLISEIPRLTKDCGAGGTFNGVHGKCLWYTSHFTQVLALTINCAAVVNNLTFAAFGITGPQPIVIPPGNPDPDRELPTRNKRSEDRTNLQKSLLTSTLKFPAEVVVAKLSEVQPGA